MNTRWVDADELEPRRAAFWLSPLFFVIVAFGVLAALLTVGVLVYNRSSSDEPVSAVTISTLRSDPQTFDGDTVVLSGTAEDVRTVPYLDQYGLYTLRDDSGSLLVLSRHGAPPSDEPLQVTGVFHGAVKLDEYLTDLLEGQLGPLAGSVIESLIPGIPLNVIFLEHEKYELE